MNNLGLMNNIISMSKVYPYTTRCIKNSSMFFLLLWGCLSIFMLYIAVSSCVYSMYIFALFFLLGSFCFVKFIISEGVVYIYHISFNRGELVVLYKEKNTFKSLGIDLSKCKMELYGGSKGIGHSPYICFYDNSKLVLKQYAIQEWTLNTMQEVAQKIEELKKAHAEQK